VSAVLTLGAVLLGLGVGGCADSAPDTPANAVMSYLTAAQVGKTTTADGRLCDRLRTSASPEESATLDQIVNHAAVFGTDIVQGQGDTVAVQLRVVFAPAPRGAQGTMWDARMVKEGGRWKVCGFQPES